MRQHMGDERRKTHRLSAQTIQNTHTHTRGTHSESQCNGTLCAGHYCINQNELGCAKENDASCLQVQASDVHDWFAEDSKSDK